MENFNLTDEEQKTYGEWFSNLDLDKQAKLNFKNVTQFLSAYQLSDDDLDKIFNICGAKRLDHFGRSQFYIALKLVSLAQNGYELSLENLSKSNLPLPRKLSSSTNISTNKFDSFTPISSATNSIPSHGILPPPSAGKSHRLKQKLSPIHQSQQMCKFCNKNLIPASTAPDQDKNLKSFVLICPNCKNSNLNSPNEFNPNIELNPSNPKNLSDITSSSDNSRCSSTELYETIDNNSLAFEKLKPWEKIEHQSNQSGLDDTDESKHCLLNDEEEQIDTNKICLNVNNDDDQYLSKSYKPESIEETDEEDIWSMNNDQIKYYFEKFCQLLPPNQDKLAGNNVKSFFEKSKLSLNDLKQIWTISDLDADGHLSIIEFCIAMHLVVLKRNKVSLPDLLPNSLNPLKINQLLEKNQLKVVSHESYDLMNLMNSDNLSSLQSNYHHLSTGNVSNISINHQHPTSTSSGEQLHRNSFDCLRNQESLNGTNATSSLNTSCGLLSNNENKIQINSPNNREWTQFSSPFSSNRLHLECHNHSNANLNDHHNNNQMNLQSNNVNSCLMTPTNFTDKIELDSSKLIQPLAIKVSSSNQQYTDSQITNKQQECSRMLNPPHFLPRPRGHARSSSLDLTSKKMFNNSSTFHHQGAFVNYRKHVQQQQIFNPNSSYSNSQSIGNKSIYQFESKKDKQFYLNQLKSKYALPKQLSTTTNSTNLINSLKERNFLLEQCFDELIDELAGTLEQLSNYRQSSEAIIRY